MGNKNLKERVIAWIEPTTIKKMDKLVKSNDMKNQSEFVSKAVEFYIGYLNSQDATEYIDPILLGAVQSSLKESENRHSSNLFRLAIEMSMMMNLLAAGFEIEDDQLKELRTKCVKDVKKSRGKISFDDAVEFQRSGE